MIVTIPVGFLDSVDKFRDSAGIDSGARVFTYVAVLPSEPSRSGGFASVGTEIASKPSNFAAGSRTGGAGSSRTIRPVRGCLARPQPCC